MKVDIGRRNLLEVNVTDSECWECTSIKPKKDNRYGRRYYQIMTGSRTDGTRKVMLLHRYIYEYFNSKIPNDMVVMHKCDNVLCVNPNHLELGTQKENMEDMSKKGRSAKGESSPSAKLTDIQVEEIRSLYGEYNQTELSKMFGVSQRHISNIVRNINRTA